ncbi:FkbM family methyltransferase [Haliea sp. E1-2-M8]|uniref:FkbM family methyltransferase n=1 Tax=Haliea sp. E1-2-M8 TaxID=3064706 RepID=UPI0027254D64|nr:FkbM family methyltransferase [Haliea sp. E1-2-M8]MDO8863359.1 FkbM family methyltransferase [Haliea sp. E1-2-M8]
MLDNTIARFLRTLGLKVNRISAKTDANTQILKSIERVGAKNVLDIGANTGQFAKGLFSAGYRGDVVSFEPLSTAHRTLLLNAQGVSNWTIHPRTAIGNSEGNIGINIAGNSESSSVLPMLKLHSDASKGSSYTDSEVTAITRLDSVAPQYLAYGVDYFLKIDTQGFEWEVLEGGSETLRHAAGIICEVSLAPLYAGAHHWMEILSRIELSGFTLWALQPNFIDLRTGQTLQTDLIFLNNGKI